jgi:hypothetical protein
MVKSTNLVVAAVVAVCSFAAQGANAATILASVQSVSSELQVGYDRGAVHAVNGDGLTQGCMAIRRTERFGPRQETGSPARLPITARRLHSI